MATELTISTVVQEFSGIGGSSTAATHPTGQIVFAGDPSDGDRVTIYSQSDQHDFFFQTTPTDYREATIYAHVSNTIYSLRNKINVRKDLNINASVYSLGTNTLKLFMRDTGAVFNVAMEKSSTNVSVFGIGGSSSTGYNTTDRTKTTKRYVALVFKTKGAFAWDFTGYLGQYKFTNGLALAEIENSREWLDIQDLTKKWPSGYLKAYSLSAAEYIDTVSNIRSAIEGA